MMLAVGEEAVLYVLAEDNPLTLKDITLPMYDAIEEARIGLIIRRRTRPSSHLQLWRVTFKPTSCTMEPEFDGPP